MAKGPGCFPGMDAKPYIHPATTLFAMEEQRPVSSVSEWLDGLQRDSWNLELLISWFSIFC
ncbi:MAG: hypothetical protein IPH16_12660 [Haliscomenobacter sp.]|nr:hypothetical protein [Haliscomenobacter sp.]